MEGYGHIPDFPGFTESHALNLRVFAHPFAHHADSGAGDGDVWRLELWGALPVGWAGNLSLHCYAVGLGIEEGEARRVDAGRWAAAFRLRAEKEATPEGQDFLHMATRRPRMAIAASDVALLEARVRPGPGGEVLEVVVRAPDRLGLLAWLLGRFALFGLHPTGLSVRTVRGEAEDRFRLAGVGGEPPSRAAATALERALAERVRPRPGDGGP